MQIFWDKNKCEGLSFLFFMIFVFLFQEEFASELLEKIFQDILFFLNKEKLRCYVQILGFIILREWRWMRKVKGEERRDQRRKLHILTEKRKNFG